MMKDLIIICEDSFGLDVCGIAKACIQWQLNVQKKPLYRLAGFIVPEGKTFDPRGTGLQVLGTVEACVPTENSLYAMGIVNPEHKQTVARCMKAKGARFVTLWAPWVLTPLKKQFGEGCIIAAHSIIEDANIGSFVTLFWSMLGTADVADYCSVMAYANITNARLGERAFIGDNASIMMDNTIGEDACVMPNSVVVRNVRPGQTVSGIPARRVREPK